MKFEGDEVREGDEDPEFVSGEVTDIEDAFVDDDIPLIDDDLLGDDDDEDESSGEISPDDL